APSLNPQLFCYSPPLSGLEEGGSGSNNEKFRNIFMKPKTSLRAGIARQRSAAEFRHVQNYNWPSAWLLLALATAAWLHPISAAATTRTVTTLNDSGAGSLRDTIAISAS